MSNSLYTVPHCVSVDWLQTYGSSAPLTEGIKKSTSKMFPQFSLVQDSVGTAMFAHLFTFVYQEKPIAIIQQCPRSSTLPKNITLIKLHNRQLYHEGIIEVLFEVHKVLFVEYRGITRLDLAYDCNMFMDGYNPAQFIQDYSTPSQPGSDYIYRRGSGKFVLHANKVAKSGNIHYNGIKFGSPSSRVSAYLYNKTLELIEVKDKGYIRKMWQNAGLINSLEYPVWRFEISIKAQGFDLLDLSSGELFRLEPGMLSHQSKIEVLFKSYSEKYCDFRRAPEGHKRKAKRIELFDLRTPISFLPHTVVSSLDTGRTEKIIVNRLKKIAKENNDLTTYSAYAIRAVIEFFENSGFEKKSRHHAKRFIEYWQSHTLETDALTRTQISADKYMSELYDYEENKRLFDVEGKNADHMAQKYDDLF